MRFRFLLFFLLPLLALNAREAAPMDKNTSEEARELRCNDKLVIGEKEPVYLPAVKMTMEARIDTGATTTSIDARDIRVQERDGKKWVLFTIVDRTDGRKEKLEKPLVKIASIKRHGMEDQKRYVVKMRINLGSISQYISVTLNDRSRYDFPVLIGRNFLRGNCVVDVDLADSTRPTHRED